jgi:T-complex protein 1 subunit theta
MVKYFIRCYIIIITIIPLIGIVATEVKDPKDPKELAKAVRTAIASKQYGYDKLLTDLVVKAALEIMPANPKNFNVDSVRVVKILGGSIHDTRVIRGMVFGREPEGIINVHNSDNFKNV